MREDLFDNMARHRVACAISLRTGEEIGDLSTDEALESRELFAIVCDAAAASVSFAGYERAIVQGIIRAVIGGSEGSWSVLCDLIWPEFRCGGAEGIWNLSSDAPVGAVVKREAK
jgi:hypothetical protein